MSEKERRITLVDVDYGDARTQIETYTWNEMALLRILGGNGWTWLDASARRAVARALSPITDRAADAAIALKDEFARRLDAHGIGNGNFMLVMPDEMRRWRDDLAAAVAGTEGGES